MLLNFHEVLFSLLSNTLVVVLGSNSVNWLKEVSIDLFVFSLFKVLFPLELCVVLLNGLGKNLLLLDWLGDSILASGLEDTVVCHFDVLALKFQEEEVVYKSLLVSNFLVVLLTFNPWDNQTVGDLIAEWSLLGVGVNLALLVPLLENIWE